LEVLPDAPPVLARRRFQRGVGSKALEDLDVPGPTRLVDGAETREMLLFIVGVREASPSKTGCGGMRVGAGPERQHDALLVSFLHMV
jgi:hypothetical protein